MTNFWCIAHKHAFALHYLHQDLSPGNIIIFEGRGYLIDWDMAKLMDDTSPRQLTHTGTWQFMSMNLMEEKDKPSVHTFKDDLEFTLYVILWTALVFTQSQLTSKQ
ncbi:hypothetical protein SCLCIDRAFT_145272, partial [Scleroderma citrinum Foug A]